MYSIMVYQVSYPKFFMVTEYKNQFPNKNSHAE